MAASVLQQSDAFLVTITTYFRVINATRVKEGLNTHTHTHTFSPASSDYRHRSTVEIVTPVKTVSSVVLMNIQDVLCAESTLIGFARVVEEKEKMMVMMSAWR